MMQEAGGRFTDLSGNDLVFEIARDHFDRNYAIVAASARLHGKLIPLTRRHPALASNNHAGRKRRRNSRICRFGQPEEGSGFYKPLI